MTTKNLLAIACSTIFIVSNYTTVLSLDANSKIKRETTKEQEEDAGFGGLYIGLGIGGHFLNNYLEEGDARQYLKNTKCFVGSFNVGIGTVLYKNFYLGIDHVLDFSKSSNFYNDTNDNRMYATALTPSLGVKAGYIFNNANIMIYSKISCTGVGLIRKLGTEIKRDYDQSPSIALGIEKKISKFIVGLEAEYILNYQKVEIDKFNRGLCIRALVKYNFWC